MDIINSIKEQADRYDGKNMQFEQDILWRIRRAHDKLNSSVLGKARPCRKLIDMQKMMNEIEDVYTSFDNAVINLLMSTLPEYMSTGYKNTGDLIELGKEISGNLSEGLQEYRKLSYTDDILDIIKNSAFKDIKGKSNAQIEKMRKELTAMVLAGEATRQNVRDMIQDVLNSNKSYAELVAQTELSSVYNMGSIKRIKEYQKISGHRMKKYWHGFKYSENTCEYCRPRIGGVYDLDDESETLPAHPVCRCMWLPIDEGWIINTKPLVSRTDMIGSSYTDEMMHDRINLRLGIQYGRFMSREAITSYLAGDRSTKVTESLRRARQTYINNLVESFGITNDTSNTPIGQDFNYQMNFWKNKVATSMADGDQNMLDNYVLAINGLMSLPWNEEQIDKWNQLLLEINK